MARGGNRLFADCLQGLQCRGMVAMVRRQPQGLPEMLRRVRHIAHAVARQAQRIVCVGVARFDSDQVLKLLDRLLISMLVEQKIGQQISRLGFVGSNIYRGTQMRFGFGNLARADQRQSQIHVRIGELWEIFHGKAQMTDAYAIVDKGEVWLRNLHIPPYEFAGNDNHEPARPRKLLLHREEIERLLGKVAQKGLTLIPTRIYFKGPRAKVELALARGKEGRDRRREIADRDVRREVEREFKGRMR